jgi:hypothetical protein
MARIDTKIFEAVSSEATLRDKTTDEEIQRYVTVYDVPKSWIRAIKKEQMTASAYLKQALREKLQRDGMLP